MLKEIVMSKEDSPFLSQQEVTSPQGCGAGTGKACFALGVGANGFECMLVSSPDTAEVMGLRMGWRVNVDESDGKVWCPKGVLAESKQSE
jgi:hypothetical protein